MKKVRCAIYTRKSSENGLEQEFNSLDAQREACAAYIASQKHEGWVLLDNAYDDGGISGGTLDRDGLQNLMIDIEAGLVDQIVVYKIDRLTRSLTDFAKLVERLDKVNASFVSVTQSFNTATSMGRLTLNVLLSFAQFEREVTSERIRDKIVASKKKGLWMGGNLPLGYDADRRSLKINSKEAETVKTVFALYKTHGTIGDVRDEAERLNLRTRPMAAKGNTDTPKGYSLLSRSNIHYMLTNPVYAGRIRHHGAVHDGQHPPLIDPNEWDEVQLMLMNGAQRCRGKSNLATEPSLLKGKLFDETGDRLTPSHTKKGNKRYRYYLSNRLLNKKNKKVPSPAGWRLSAKLLEDQISQAVVHHLKSTLLYKLTASRRTDEIGALAYSVDALDPKMDQVNILECVHKVNVARGNMHVELGFKPTIKLLTTKSDQRLNGPNTILAESNSLTFNVPFQHRKRGVETKFIIGELQSEQDKTLIQNLAMAHYYLNEIKSGKHIDEIATSSNSSKRRIMQIIDLAFLAPDIVKSIFQGKQPCGLTTKYLQRHPLPANWQEQRKIIQAL